MIGVIGLLSAPTLFALPIYIGWVSPTPSTPIRTTLMFSKPETLQRSALEKGASIAHKVLASDARMRDRFDLVARLFNRAMGLPPTDETFLWAWTCLEVFTMMGSNGYSVIASYLAKVTGDDAAALADRLDIKGLHDARSKLVHSGNLGKSPYRPCAACAVCHTTENLSGFFKRVPNRLLSFRTSTQHDPTPLLRYAMKAPPRRAI
jgi:hypothetical protein